MTSFLKKFQLLKKKEGTESSSKVNQGHEQWNNQEAHFSGFQPSSSHNPTTQRTSQILPLLVKPSPAPTDVKKKVQPQPLVLPELVQRQPTKIVPVTTQVEDKAGAKELAILPKLYEKEKARKNINPQGRKRIPDATAPLYPELSDEQFKYLWDNKKTPRRKSIKEFLETMDEREVLDTILDHLRISHQILLYKYYGLKLRDSRQKDLVKEYLKMLLALSLQEETDREGIAEAIGVIAYSHPSEILFVLKDLSHYLQARKFSQTEAALEESRIIYDRHIHTTIILCYGQTAVGAKPEDMLVLVEHIVTEILLHFGITNKDEAIKKAFMRSVIMVSKALLQSRKQDVNIPYKLNLAVCIIEVIEEEPLGSFSVMILHQAIITVTCMSSLKPALNSEVRSELVGKSIQKVFSLPALKMTKLKAGSPMQPAQTQAVLGRPQFDPKERPEEASSSGAASDFYQQTITAHNTMLTSLLSEAPNLDSLQDILIHTNIWIDSPKNYERERAVKSTSHLLKFVSEHLDFDTTAEFSLLGQLLALLALHIADSVKEIGQTSAEATYHLHYIIMSRMAKEMEKKRRNKKGNIVKWFREDFFISGPSVFYNNISKVAKAFGEHLSPSQLTDLVVKLIETLTHEDKNISQAAGQLLSSFLEECGMDMEELPMIVKEIYNRLPKITDPVTREETLKSVCHLASKRLNGVVDILLECSVECDDSASDIWKALFADPYSNMKIIRPLLKRLQDEDPLIEASLRRNSMSVMPIAATNVLCYVLTLPEALDAIQNKFPHLLIALVTQIYYVIGTGKRGPRRVSVVSNTSTQPTPLSKAVQALKNLISCAGYVREYNILGMQGCWDMLVTSETFFDGVFHLVRTLFTFTKVHLKIMFKQANTYLRHVDVKERTVGMAFFTELLYHSEIGLFFMKQDILDVLREWMSQSCPLMRVFSIRGLGYLLQHSLENESLEPLLHPLVSCALEPERNIAKESIKTLQYMFRHLEVEEYGFTAVSLIPHLRSYFSDEDNDLRCSSIILFGILLNGVREMHRESVMEDIIRSLVPLLIQLTDGWTREVTRNTLNTCTSFMNWTDIPSNIFDYEVYDNLYSAYLNISKLIIWKYKHKFPEMLAQMMEYLKSKNASYREAAAILIACNAQFMKPDTVTSKEVEDVFLALRDLQGDCEASVAKAAIESMEEVFRHSGHRINPSLVPNQLLSVLSKNSIKAPLDSKQ